MLVSFTSGLSKNLYVSLVIITHGIHVKMNLFNILWQTRVMIGLNIFIRMHDLEMNIKSADFYSKVREKIGYVLFSGAFTDLAQLSELDLGYNIIHTVESGAFDLLPALATLRLNDNQLVAVPKAGIETVSSLVTLDLSTNAIDALAESKAFGDLINLQSLFLHVSQLSFLYRCELRGPPGDITVHLFASSIFAQLIVKKHSGTAYICNCLTSYGYLLYFLIITEFRYCLLCTTYYAHYVNMYTVNVSGSFTSKYFV